MFGKRLKQLRENNSYSMDKLIDLYNNRYNAKMNKSTLSRYENELQDPIYTVVVNLAKIFNVSVDYLSGFSNIPNQVLNNAHCDISPLYNKLDENDKAEIRGEIKQMLKADKYNNRHIPYIPREIAAYGADGTKGTYTKPEKETT